MFYNGFRVLVLYIHKEWADKWVEDFKNKVDHSAIAGIKRMGKGSFTILMRDGTCIESAKFSFYNSRGSKYDKIYVEDGIDTTQNDFYSKYYPQLLPQIVEEYTW